MLGLVCIYQFVQNEEISLFLPKIVIKLSISKKSISKEIRNATLVVQLNEIDNYLDIDISSLTHFKNNLWKELIFEAKHSFI